MLPFRTVTAADLETWLRSIVDAGGIESTGAFGAIGAIDFGRIAPLAGDLSQRRYFRVGRTDGRAFVAAYYPESWRGTMARFAAARSLLVGVGVRAPAIYHSSPESGWMLVEDLGPATLYEIGDEAPGAREAHVTAAIESARRIAGLDAEAVSHLGNPPLDGPALQRELDPTFEYLFDRRGLAGRAVERHDLRQALAELCLRLAEAPLVACHRDYMSRNLVPVADGLAVIDFQDLRLGPAAYDLASLLNDSYFPDLALEARLLPAEFRSGAGSAQYSRAVVQRTLKAAGTFARFAAQGRPRHLPLIAPTLARAARHIAALPETGRIFGPLREWWARQLSEEPIC